MTSVNRAVLLGALLSFVCPAARASGRLTASAADDLYTGLGNIAWAFHRDAELLPVRVEGKWGFIDPRGRLVVEPRFDEVRACVGGAAPFRQGGFWGIVSRGDSVLVPAAFRNADILSEGMMAVETSQGWTYLSTGQIAAAAKGDESYRKARTAWSFVSYAGLRFDSIPYGVGAFHDGFAVVGPMGHDRLVSRGLDEWAGGTMTAVSAFGEGLAAVEFQGDSQGVVIIDTAGRRVGRFRHGREMGSFSSGLAPALNLPATEREQALWGYVDRSGEWAVPPRYAKAADFSEGMAHVSDVAGEGHRHGFVSPSGKLAIPLSFIWAGDFWNGYAPVCLKRGRCGFIDKTGKPAVKLEHDAAVGAMGGLFLVGDAAEGDPGRLIFSYVRKDGRAVWPNAFSLPD